MAEGWLTKKWTLGEALEEKAEDEDESNKKPPLPDLAVMVATGSSWKIPDSIKAKWKDNEAHGSEFQDMCNLLEAEFGAPLESSTTISAATTTGNEPDAKRNKVRGVVSLKKILLCRSRPAIVPTKTQWPNLLY